MTCFTRGIDSQETETLEVDSEGEKSRRESEEQNVNLSDQSLAFDEEKQEIQDIKIGISQESSISPILFLIYIRFLFSKIKAKFSEV